MPTSTRSAEKRGRDRCGRRGIRITPPWPRGMRAKSRHPRPGRDPPRPSRELRNLDGASIVPPYGRGPRRRSFEEIESMESHGPRHGAAVALAAPLMFALIALPGGPLIHGARAAGGDSSGVTPAVHASPIAPAQTLQPEAVSPAKSKTPSFLGAWKLNLEKSDTFADKMHEAMRSHGEHGGGYSGHGGGGYGGHGGGGYGGHGGGGYGGHGGMGGGAEGGGDAAEGDGAAGGSEPPRHPEMQMLMRPPLSLAIDQTDTSVVFEERGRVIETLIFAGRAPEPDTEPGAPPTWRAKWRGQHLVAESPSRNGRKLEQSLELSNDAKELIVTTTIENSQAGSGPIELRRIYDRDEGE